MLKTSRLQTALKTLLKDSNMFVVMMSYLNPPHQMLMPTSTCAASAPTTMSSPQSSVTCQVLSFSPQTDSLIVHNIEPLPCLQPPSSIPLTVPEISPKMSHAPSVL